MRITNRIMQRNNLSNINTNKIYQDRLSNQMSSQKKINRPSDDPVVAIRSLRLRSNVTEITQYYSKNILDAESWLKVTEDAISNLAQVITTMLARCDKGANTYLETKDRKIILEEMQGLRDAVYSTGDADYAGRYVFTGYRTDTSLSFLTAKKQNYTMTEQLDKGAIDSVSKVDVSNLLDINSTNYMTMNVDEDNISSVDVHRIRLAYSDCSDYGDFDKLKSEQNALIEKNASAINQANPPLGYQVGNVDLNNLSADEETAIKDAVNQVITDLENANPPADQEVIDRLKNWQDNPAENLKDHFAEINNKLNNDPNAVVDGNRVQVGVTPPDAQISNDIADIGKIVSTTASAADWDANQAAFNDLASPTIQFTSPGSATFMDQKWGGFAEAGGYITLMHSYETSPNPYAYTAANPDAIVYIPETGEMLLGENRYAELMATKDSAATATQDEGEIRVTYEKNNWKKGDLRPEHYFYCQAEKEDGSGEYVTYNESYLTPEAERQVIEYDVGYNQMIRINSTADECFKHDVGREVDDIVNAMQDVLDLEGVKADLENIKQSIQETDTAALAQVQKQLDAVEKALTYAKDKEQKLFEGGLTNFQKNLDDANVCVTDCGSRGSKLELIKNRTQNQKTTYETLKSENEDVDITEVAIELSAAELTYDAALMAAGKVMQSTLLNFI